MSIVTFLFLFVVVLILTRTRAAAAEVTLSAGAARTDITPDPVMVNWVDGRPYDGVLDPLTLRGLVLSDGNTEFALICWDLIDVTEECAANVRRAVHGATGIPGTHVLMAASHTHSSPRSPFAASTFPGRKSERLRGILDDPVFRAWSERLPGTCADVLKRARDCQQPVTLNIGRANASEWLFKPEAPRSRRQRRYHVSAQGSARVAGRPAFRNAGPHPDRYHPSERRGHKRRHPVQRSLPPRLHLSPPTAASRRTGPGRPTSGSRKSWAARPSSCRAARATSFPSREGKRRARKWPVSSRNGPSRRPGIPTPCRRRS